ncbi:hypothetical protein [Streptomyces carpinensis]|uniref:Uncharacterized protein n=1 Tax=Streptomyces carpinensis TaxID=66369 RepID=A0ABV1WKY4_9ACTN|nr:hypothetical protein [Streptomyces carpinensis]
MDDSRDAEVAPPPDAGAEVFAYGPYDVVRINLRVASEPYRGVAVAHYDAPDGRRAYRLALWPRPDVAPHGWYWWDEGRMTRRDFRRPRLDSNV